MCCFVSRVGSAKISPEDNILDENVSKMLAQASVSSDSFSVFKDAVDFSSALILDNDFFKHLNVHVVCYLTEKRESPDFERTVVPRRLFNCFDMAISAIKNKEGGAAKIQALEKSRVVSIAFIIKHKMHTDAAHPELKKLIKRYKADVEDISKINPSKPSQFINKLSVAKISGKSKDDIKALLSNFKSLWLESLSFFSGPYSNTNNDILTFDNAKNKFKELLSNKSDLIETDKNYFQTLIDQPIFEFLDSSYLFVSEADWMKE